MKKGRVNAKAKYTEAEIRANRTFPTGNTVLLAIILAEIGAPLSSIADTDADYRFLVTGNYMTFYRVSGENVYVDRILYGRRDYLRILIGDQLEEENLQ